jgi:predicted dehydrogenase
MARANRREFLMQAGIGLAAAVPSRAQAPQERITLGVIGCGGMGSVLLQSFAAMKDVVVAYVCDPDATRLAAAAQSAAQTSGRAPKAVKDLRRLLDDKAVDAVVIATPDHWHAPAMLLACAAGKHVYVEKPCAHNIREGRLMIEAARRYGRVVQTGTQTRSLRHTIEAIQKLREGIIGDVLVAKAWNSQLRGNIGHKSPSAPPPELDFDLWLGPAPARSYQSNLLHGNWRWWYDFGSGDIGNDGVHDIDIARWGLGVETHPSTVAAIGGKSFFDDDQQFPDTQYVIYDYPADGRIGHKRQLVYEQRIWSPYVQEGFENGNAFYGTKGMMLLGKKEGWKVFGPRNEPGPKMDSGGFDSAPHHRDFLDCIRTGRTPNADIEIGHLSASLSHLGNIAARVGRVLRFDPKAEWIMGDEEAQRLIGRQYRNGHWAKPKIEPA